MRYRLMLQRMFPQLKLVSLPLGEGVYESSEKLDYVYFPISCIVSLLNVMVDGSSAEILVMSNKGEVGIAVFMGGESTSNRAIVQSARSAYRLPAWQLRKQFESESDMRMLMLRYTQSLITQTAVVQSSP
jgi:hypothetical protein